MVYRDAHIHCSARGGKQVNSAWKLNWLRIPMMSISHSDLMPIRSERSDAGLSQFEILIGISQDFCLFSLS